MDTAAIAADMTAVQNADMAAKDMDALTTGDFLKLLITELTQQDPFEPMKNQELLNQISSIRQLEMNTQLNDTLESLALQGNLGSAAGLIGKTITGLDLARHMVSGPVSGVLVRDGEIVLELGDGNMVRLEDVTHVVAETQPVAAADAADATDSTDSTDSTDTDPAEEV